tara:strand:- start:879 stop:1070 length:192 start_codon:yes stop_codon:yes gene_type:complete
MVGHCFLAVNLARSTAMIVLGTMAKLMIGKISIVGRNLGKSIEDTIGDRKKPKIPNTIEIRIA